VEGAGGQADAQLVAVLGMSALGTKLRLLQDGRLAFWCPGCDESHHVRVGVEGRPCWTFDGDVERPTFAPSVLVTGTQLMTDDEHARLMRGEHVEPRPMRCHSFVRAGHIEFLTDCTHALAGQTADLPAWPAPDMDW
jgi:hypothetical protein